MIIVSCHLYGSVGLATALSLLPDDESDDGRAGVC
jgi:hypothetical protein